MRRRQAMVEIESLQTSSVLEQIARQAARQMLATALQQEAEAYIEAASHERDEHGRRMVVGNGLAQERSVQSTIGTITVRQPRIDDKREGKKFSSAILPPFIRRTMAIDAIIPLLYLHGVSTVRMHEALKGIIGDAVGSLSPAVVTRIMESWQQQYKQFTHRRINRRYVYVWVDGIYTRVRTSYERPCMLVLIGCDEQGNKELLAVSDGERESELSWIATLTDLKQQGLAAPRLAIGDGAMGFWAAISKVYPSTNHQGCTVHAMRNALDKVPKRMQEDVKKMLNQIFQATSRADALDAFDDYEKALTKTHPKAVETIKRRLPMLLEYFNYPTEHWKSIRTTNVIESTFATIRRRSRQTNGNASREAAVAMMFALAVNAQKTWRKIDGFNHIADVLSGATFVDGELKQAA